MKKTLLLVITLFGLTALADTYKIDTAASSVLWKGGKKTGSFHHGTIKVKAGQVEVDGKGIISGGQVVVDMKTIGNDDLKDDPKSQGKLIGHLSSDDFFGVEKHPEATFQFKSVTLKAGSKDEYLVKGSLTMIGSTQEVEFVAKMKADKGSLSGSAVVQIERLKWGLKYGSGSIFKTLTADKIINDTFELTLNLVAKK